MNSNEKIERSHEERAAIVYVPQSSMGQVRHNLESQRRQCQLADLARQLGFATVTVIDEDQGRSGSGSVQRTGFLRLLDLVFQGQVGAVFELFEQLGSARQDLLYHQKERLDLPSEHEGEPIWSKPTYSRVLAFLNNPTYAGTFVFGRRRDRRNGRHRSGRTRTLLRDPGQWQTVIHDHDPGYIRWERFERNQNQLRDNTAAEELGSWAYRRPPSPALRWRVVKVISRCVRLAQ